MYSEGDLKRWEESLRPGDTFHITGIEAPPSRKRFKKVTSNVRHALGINLWQGNVWLVRDGKRRSIRKVTN